MHHRWLDEVRRALHIAQPVVLVTVARADGSTPRDAGTKMVVTRTATFQTIGGGHLEWQAIDTARTMLSDGARASNRFTRFSLGPSLGQCCGGAVTLAFEYIAPDNAAWVEQLATRLAAGQASRRSVSFAPSQKANVTIADLPANAPHAMNTGDSAANHDRATDALPDGTSEHDRCVVFDDKTACLNETIAPSPWHIVVLGAGHVGRALVSVLATLPCSLTWADERDAPLSGTADTQIAGIPVIRCDALETVIDEAPAGSCFVVMTHSHALDQTLCERILKRGDYRYFGLIGSLTKRVQFERRLSARGIPDEALARMVCPIGIPGIIDKSPEVIAVSVAAELLLAASL